MLQKPGIAILDAAFGFKPNNVVNEFPSVLNKPRMKVKRDWIAFARVSATCTRHNNGRSVDNQEAPFLGHAVHLTKHLSKEIQIIIIAWINRIITRIVIGRGSKSEM